MKKIIYFTCFMLLLSGCTKKQKEEVDENNTDWLIGEWLYPEVKGSYQFENDGSYNFYGDDNHSDNYCNGTYQISYGALKHNASEEYYQYKEDGYSLYTLLTYPTRCILDGNEAIYQDTEGASAFVLFLSQENANEMRMYNLSTYGTFDVYKQ